ncbi:MAG: glycosyltransferase family 4 protein [Deltaproteobacteria bacterium]|nr:glycosyltransferase family 4 protein [Deltaproteobacteria bacterium]
MHIGFMIYGSIDTLTGGYLYDKKLLDYLTDSGHHVEVISLPLRRYPLRPADNFTGALPGHMTRASYDILLQDELCHPSLFLLNRRLHQRTSVPVVSVVHHLLCNEPRSRVLNALLALPETHYLDSADGFVFNSRTTQCAVFHLSPAPRPFVVAPPGSDRFRGRITSAEIAARAPGPGPLRLLFVGQIIERKGLLPLIAALTGVPRDQWSLEVVGNTTIAPDYFRRVRQALDTHGLASIVRFPGSLDTDALARKFAESHLLCMPFAYEGFGMVTLEALNFGLPVLGANAGATPELIRDGDNGLLFNRNDLSGVATAVQKLHADRSRLLRMSAAALESAGTHPVWQESMQGIEEFLINFHALMRRR